MIFPVRRGAVLRCVLTLIIVLAAARPVVEAAPLSAPQPDVSDLPAARHGHTLASIGSNAYLFGGLVDGAPQNDLWLYANGWTAQTIANRPPERADHAAAVVANVMYVFFGQGAAGDIRADVWAYNPYSRLWSQRPSLGDAPAPRFGHSAVAVGNEILIFGGQTGDSQPDGCVYRYQTQTGQWTRGACLSSLQPFVGHAAATINGVMFVYPGGAPLDRLLRYAPQSDAWSTQAVADPGYAPRRNPAVATRDNRLWLFGGEIEGMGETTNILEITLQADGSDASLRPLPCLAAARSDAQAAAVSVASNTYYSLTTTLIFGGVRSGQAVSDTVIYWIGPPQPAATPTQAATATPTATRTVSATPSPTSTSSRTPTPTIAYGWRVALPVVLGSDN
jgi:N-acetylneuraminic acid mutarotase